MRETDCSVRPARAHARAQSNTELLLGFGFVLVDNPQDLVAVAVGVDAGDAARARRGRLRAAAGFEPRQYLRLDGVIPDGATVPRPLLSPPRAWRVRRASDVARVCVCVCVCVFVYVCFCVWSESA